MTVASVTTGATVAEVWRYPVKSMAGERVATADLAAGGLAGDRAWALLDVATGRIASAKNVRDFPDLLRCRAALVGAPAATHATPPVRIVFPDGAATTSDAPDAERILSAHFGREVRLVTSAPDDFTVDQYYPDVDGAGPPDARDVTVARKLGAALFGTLGAPSPIAPGALVNAFPVSIITTSTLERFSTLEPGSRFDARRFRMNLIVATPEPGFVENGWLGRSIAVGPAVRLRVALPDPRCVVITRGQEGLDEDVAVLRAVARHNRIAVGAAGLLPCAGVYAVVEQPGVVRAGDAVRVESF